MAGESQDRPLAPSFFLSVQPVSRKALDISFYHIIWSYEILHIKNSTRSKVMLFDTV